MVVLKIIGVALAVIAVLIIIALSVRLKLVIAYNGKKQLGFKVKYLFLSFGGKKKKPESIKAEGTAKPEKKKKPSKFVKRIKKKFGLDVLETELKQGGFADKVSQITALVMLFAGQIKWIFSKLRVDLLKVLILCGGNDAADTAIDYGIVCSAVYPMAGYLSANINMKDNAENIQIGCNFDGETSLEFELIISIRTIHLLTALINALGDIAEKTEEINNEQ